MTPFRHSRRVAFCETDLAGVMHFSNYYRWMEDAEHALWRSIGRSVHAQAGAAAISWPRVATRCDYYAPLRFEDEAEIVVRLVKVGGKSLTFEFEFRRDGLRVAVGQSTCVCCRLESGRFEPIDIPADVRELLASSSG